MHLLLAFISFLSLLTVNKSSIASVGIASGKKLKIFYKEGDDIIIKICSPTSYLEHSKNCNESFVKMPQDVFKQQLQDFYNQDIYQLKEVKFFTFNESQEYAKKLNQPLEIDALVQQMEKFTQFQKNNGQTLPGHYELEECLKDERVRESAINKISAELEKAMNLIRAEGDVTVLANDPTLSFMLNKFSEEGFICGALGPVTERIKHCSYQTKHKAKELVLVSRNIYDGKTFVIYQDSVTGHLWGPTMKALEHNQATSYCKSLNDNKTTGMQGFTWRLPALEEYQNAHNLKYASNLEDNYMWTSSVNDPPWFAPFSDVTTAYAYNEKTGESGKVDNRPSQSMYLNSFTGKKVKFRCMAVPAK